VSLKKFFKGVEKSLRPFGRVIEGAVSAIPGGASLVAARRVAVSARHAAATGQKIQARAADWGAGSVSLIKSGYGAQPMSLLPSLLGAGSAMLRGGGAIVKRGQIVKPGAGKMGDMIGTAATVAGAGALIYDVAGNVIGRRARRRSKGITATQLKAFTRVTAILNKYCKTPPPTGRRRATRSTKCR
jgi:hypothetical protein